MTAKEFYESLTQEQRQKVNRYKKRTPYKDPSKRRVITEGYMANTVANMDYKINNLTQGQIYLINAIQTGLQNVQVEANKLSKLSKKKEDKNVKS